ncbi:MAG: T9SS type A sorting domain-containing protein, partial [Chitinophagaceae bacterium]
PLCAAALLAGSMPAAAQSGTVDATFELPFAGGQPINTVVALPGGKVLIGGSRISPSGPGEGVLRLNADGSVDPSWDNSNWGGFSLAYPGGVQHLIALPSGKHLSAGTGNGFSFIILGDANGSYDPAFANQFFATGNLRAIGVQSTGHIVIAGDKEPGTSFPAGIGRLDATGNMAAFSTGSGISIEPTLGGNTVTATGASITALAVQPDDKIIIAGRFTHYDGVETGNIVRLNADGTLDNSFNAGIGSLDPGTGDFVAVNDLLIAPSGAIYAATSLPSQPNANRIVRLTATGARDAGFINNFVYGGDVKSISLTPDGKVLVGGDFLVAGSPTGAGIALLDATGFLDPAFRVGMDVAFAQPGFVTVSDVAVTANGAGALAVGNFLAYDGTAREHALRLNLEVTPPAFPPNQVVCSGTAVDALVFTIPPGYTVAWTNSEPSIGLAASGTGNVPDFTASNNGSTALTAVITVTVTEVSSGKSKSVVYRITVKPVPAVDPVSDRSLCAGANGTVAFSGSLGGTTYSWTNSNTAIGLSASGTGNISFIAKNPANTLQTATVMVTPVKEQCAGAPTSFTIDVSPAAGSIAYSQPSYCQSGSAFVQMRGSSGGGSFSAAPAGLALNPANGQISLAASAPGTYTVTYTVAASGGCAATATTQVTIMPQVSVNPVPNQDLCVGMASGTVTFSGTATSFTWTNSNPAIGLAASGSGNIASFVPTATGAASIRVTPQGPAGTCPGKSFVFHIRVGSCTVSQPGDTGGDGSNSRSNLLSVSPNPASGSTTLQYSGTEQGPFVLEVVNAFGQPALRPVTLSGKTARLDLSGLLPGVYQLRLVNTRTGVVSQKQVIKL